MKFGSEAWVLKKREEQRLEAAQMNFLRHLLGITNLDTLLTKSLFLCFQSAALTTAAFRSARLYLFRHVRPSVRLYQHGSHWTDLRDI